MKHTSIILASIGVLALAACQTDTLIAAPKEPSATSATALEAALDAQPDDVKARYGARNPGETIAFFEIEPGMTVVEALPGGGWYSKILIPYLGPDGQLIGAHYPDEIWGVLFGESADPERVSGLINRADGWVEGAREWYGDEGADLQQYKMTAAPTDENSGTVDAILFIRALHNLNRAEEELSTLSGAIGEAYLLLKPNGVVGVVQHRGPETNSDEWADGNAGYLKQSFVIEAFESAGFEFEASSEMNANPLDRPSEDDVVWRLPPSRASTQDGTPERAAVDAIGESDRMTLRFRKPA